jgi:diguanylate cyclase (GGDEF)-like protein
VTAANLDRRAVLAGAVAGGTLVFLGLVFLERPGLGLAHFFYLPIAVVAIVFGARAGVLAGVGAAVLYTLAVVANASLPTFEVLTISTPIRLLAYALSGGLIGYFAEQNRDLIGRLEVLVERDRLTGLPNARGFEAAVDKRFALGQPFAILLGDLDGLRELNASDGHGEGDFVLVRLAETLGRLVGPDEQIARVGGDEFAILASVRTKEAAAERANRLEQRLREHGLVVTFGWSAFPDEGSNALGLVRIADERLYARKLVRGRRLDAPQAAPRLVAG